MTYEEYWFKDPLLVRDYLRAEEYRKKDENHALWLSGQYIAEAISATIGNAFRKEGSSAYTYPSKPYPITSEDFEELKREQEEQEAKNAEIYMRLLVEQGKNWGKKPIKKPS